MVTGLIERFLAGEPRALARLVSLIERGGTPADDAVAALYPHSGRAHVVGITGPPGAGKSSLIGALIEEFRAAGRRVGVVAVDPSSPRSGGAVLGDRLRMMSRHADEGVFIRSLASRGRLGGLAAVAGDVVHLLDAAGYDVVLVETVGAGQDGVAVADLAHSVVVVQVPGLGDGVQAIKAGMLEIGDLFVVNKADLPGADEVDAHLRLALPTSEADEAWHVPILRVSASTGDGVAALRAAIDDHLAHLRRGDGERWRARVRAIARAETLDRVRTELEWRLTAAGRGAALDARLDAVAERRLSPGVVAAAFIAAVDSGLSGGVPGGGDAVGDQGRGRPGADPVVDVDDDQTRRA